jgi:hypothetical protein
MEEALQALKQLNVFAQMRPKPTGNAMFSKARLNALSDGIFGVAMTRLILDIRLPEDFSPRVHDHCACTCGSRYGRWR